MSPILSCHSLTFYYDKDKPPVFKDLAFSIEPGEAVVLMGPSGCGKSTLAYCLSGLYPEYAGTLEGDISLGGDPLPASPCHRAKRMLPNFLMSTSEWAATVTIQGRQIGQSRIIAGPVPTARRCRIDFDDAA